MNIFKRMAKKKEKKVAKKKAVHCKGCGGRGFDPDGLQCLECKGKGKV